MFQVPGYQILVNLSEVFNKASDFICPGFVYPGVYNGFATVTNLFEYSYLHNLVCYRYCSLII